MQTIVRVGLDLAKNVLQVHAFDAQGKVITNRAIQRSKFLAWCTQLPAGCWSPWRLAAAHTTGAGNCCVWGWMLA